MWWIPLVLAEEPALVPPVLQRPLEPVWPANVSGALGPQDVRLELQLDTEGHITRCEVLSGEEPFVTAAVSLSQQLLFDPALEDGKPVPVLFELTVHFEPPPVSGVVGSYRAPTEEHALNIAVDRARLLPGTLGDPLRMLQLLPGTVRMPLDSGWLLVRGGTPRDTAILVDGVRVPNLQHMGGFTSILHPAWFSKLDFWAGMGPARDGRATSGAVEVQTLPTIENLQVRAGANLALADLFLTVPLRTKLPVGFGVALRRSYLDSIVGLVANSDAIPSFWDWQARLDIGRTRTFAFGDEDTVRGSSPTGNEVVLKMEVQRVQSTIPIGAFRLSPWLGRDVSSVQVLNTGELREDEGDAAGVRLDYTSTDSGLVGFQGGADLWIENHQVRADALERHLWLASPEPWLNLRLGDAQRELHLGTRLDTLLVEGQLPRISASPRLSGSLLVSPQVRLVADLGLLHQPPPTDLLIGPPEGAELELEQSWSVSTGLRANPGPWTLQLDGYFRGLDRLTSYETDGSLGQGQGQAFGLESWLRFQEGRVDSWISYSLTRSLRREEPGLPWQPATTDQPHTLVVVGLVDLGKNWSVSGRFRYSSGLPRPALIPDVVDLLTGNHFQLDPDATRLPAFHSLDLKVAKTASFRKGELEVYLDVQNLYNHRIPEPVLTSLSDTYPTWVVSLPILPLFGLEAHWP